MQPIKMRRGRRLKSVHLGSTHHAFDTRIFQKECKTLAAAGYAVTFIVPHDRDEKVDGVQIRAVPKPRSGRERLQKTLKLIYHSALAEDADAIFHFHDAELLPYMLLLKLRGRRVVYDAHENTPQQMLYQHWIPCWLRRPIAALAYVLEALGGGVFDGLVAAEPVTAQRFPVRKTAVIRNFPLVSELAVEDAAPYAERQPLIVYVGSITRARGIEELVAALHRLPARLEARLALGGVFHPAQLEQAMQGKAGWERVSVKGWLDRRDVADLLAQARVGVVVLHPTQKYINSYPTKLFEYMGVGLPVIASDFPVWRQIVEEAGCGLLVNPLDVEALSEAMRWMLEHPAEAEAMGKRGRAAVEARYSWHREAEALFAFYNGLSRGR